MRKTSLALSITTLCLFSTSCSSLSDRSFPSDGSNESDTISSKEDAINVVVKLTLTKTPSKTTYYVGEVFDPSGLVAEATWDDGFVETLDGESLSFPTTPLTAADKEVIGTYEGLTLSVPITVIDEQPYYIYAGSVTYSLSKWNELFPNQSATGRKENGADHLSIALKEGTTTTITLDDGQSLLDGTLDWTNFKSVTISGNGTLNVNMAAVSDAINANNLIIEEGATVNLEGASTSDKSGIKVLESMQINGKLAIHNFAYGQAVAQRGDGLDAYAIQISVGQNGLYEINGCKFGIYGWKSLEKTPTIQASGKLNINTTDTAIRFEDGLKAQIIFDNECTSSISSSTGRCIWNTSGAVYLRDSAKLTLTSPIATVTGIDAFIIGNGEDGNIQNGASLTATSIGTGNLIESYSGSRARTNKLVFNTTGNVVLNSAGGNGISFGNPGNSSSFFKLSCASFVGENLNYLFTTTRSLDQAIGVTYSYIAPNNKVTIRNCAGIFDSSNQALSGLLGEAFTSSTVNLENA